MGADQGWVAGWQDHTAISAQKFTFASFDTALAPALLPHYRYSNAIYLPPVSSHTDIIPYAVTLKHLRRCLTVSPYLITRPVDEYLEKDLAFHSIGPDDFMARPRLAKPFGSSPRQRIGPLRRMKGLVSWLISTPSTISTLFLERQRESSADTAFSPTMNFVD